MKKKIYFITALVLTASMCSMTGCSDSTETAETTEAVTEATEAETESTTEAETEQTTEETFRVIGTEQEGDNIYSLNLVNSTGYEITSLSVSYDDVDFPDDMLGGEAITSDEEVTLYYDSTEAVEAYAESGDSDSDSDEKVLTPEFKIELTIAVEDDALAKCTLHQFPFGDVEKAEIKYDEEGYAYIIYTSIESGEEVNTSESELYYELYYITDLEQDTEANDDVVSYNSANENANNADNANEAVNNETVAETAEGNDDTAEAETTAAVEETVAAEAETTAAAEETVAVDNGDDSADDGNANDGEDSGDDAANPNEGCLGGEGLFN